jgi:transcriptional regulator
MYIPAPFRQDDQASICAFMRTHSFATLVSGSSPALIGTHLPLLVDELDGRVVLRGHVARVNPQWHEAQPGVLAIFLGPHAYISATWYDTDDTVPTWNYQAVHATGTLHVIEDDISVRRFLADLAAHYEHDQSVHWQSRLSPESLQRFMAQIVCFRIDVDRLQCAYKLSQHHPIDRTKKVVAALRQQGGDNAHAIAAAMEATIT